MGKKRCVSCFDDEDEACCFDEMPEDEQFLEDAGSEEGDEGESSSVEADSDDDDVPSADDDDDGDAASQHSSVARASSEDGDSDGDETGSNLDGGGSADAAQQHRHYSTGTFVFPMISLIEFVGILSRRSVLLHNGAPTTLSCAQHQAVKQATLEHQSGEMTHWSDIVALAEWIAGRLPMRARRSNGLIINPNDTEALSFDPWRELRLCHEKRWLRSVTEILHSRAPVTTS